MVTAIAPEGTWEGYPIDLIADIANAVDVPVIAHGGAGSRDIESLLRPLQCVLQQRVIYSFIKRVWVFSLICQM